MCFVRKTNWNKVLLGERANKSMWSNETIMKGLFKMQITPLNLFTIKRRRMAFDSECVFVFVFVVIRWQSAAKSAFVCRASVGRVNGILVNVVSLEDKATMHQWAQFKWLVGSSVHFLSHLSNSLWTDYPCGQCKSNAKLDRWRRRQPIGKWMPSIT